MGIADIAKLHSAFIAGHIGEEVRYRRHPSPVWEDIWAEVQRNPVDEMGGVLQSTINVFVSKSVLPAVTPREDDVQLAQTEPGVDPPTYRVRRILSQGAGHWNLEATK